MRLRKQLKKEAGKTKKGSRNRRNPAYAWKEVIEKFFKDVMEGKYKR